MTYTDISRKKLLVDTGLEVSEIKLAKDLFVNTDFLGAAEHFKKALEANKNSYLSQYFASLCEIYLKESNQNFDVMERVIYTVKSSLTLMSRANVTVDDKLAFIIAMLAEIKIIVINRLNSYDDIYETDVVTYRKKAIADLQKLMELFKIDGELLMTFSPTITGYLMEIIDCAIKVCYKAVQTVAIGGELYLPTNLEYKQLVMLCNDYCFFAQSFDPQFNARNYVPDFAQNTMLNEKVLSRFEEFDESNKANAKKFLIGDITEYNEILEECKKAITFTYRSCYRSMCSRHCDQHLHLLVDGLNLLYRILMPRAVMVDKKHVMLQIGNFSDIVDWCNTLTNIIFDLKNYDENSDRSLQEFYAKVLDIVEMYFMPEFEKSAKLVNKMQATRGDDFKYYEKLLYTSACCCMPALKTYVSYTAPGKDKSRAKLVKLCKMICEEFLLLWGYKIDDLEQSNFYRPILDLYNAVLEEISN
ncbi:MAG: hypothetical protein NC184_01075 [Roseburia sp.]|nr:hypothetical protein [Roseburia sp.]